jgi:uncharacterized membrane protein YeaQ/YmgE (transglycosylase-associated protein family)
VGFGTLAGLLAKMILPVRHASGSVPTILLGVVGSVVGLLVLSLLAGDRPLNPISPLGFLAATAGAFALLILNHLVCACFFREKNDPDRQQS